MSEVIKTTFQLRRGLKSAWEKNNPLLAAGEPGYELDTHKVKIGDGASLWKDLPYIGEHNIISYSSPNDFPLEGNVNYIYKANDEAMLYHWNAKDKKYEILGPSKSEDVTITIIDGGDAFGPID